MDKPMGIRRVLASRVDNKSRVVDDTQGITNAFSEVSGFDPVLLWKSAPGKFVSQSGRPEKGQSVLPHRGGTSLLIVTFPPDECMQNMKNPEAAGREYLDRLPGLAETFEAENPGMHTTDTVDYGIVLEGEIACVFDVGEVTLKAGDVIVQGHTRHGWSNRTKNPAKIAFILIG